MGDMVDDTWLERHGDQLLRGGGALLITFALLWVVHRALRHQGRLVAGRVAGGGLTAEADTRLRFLRRLVDAAIVIVGVLVAISQFTAVDQLAGTVLASSAIVAAVVGFAARQTLANAIAGFMLAITQPVRIGDVVTFEQDTGTVEDVRLTYTWIRTAGGTRVIVPNERLAAGVLRNDSIADPHAVPEASVWLHRDVDVVAALDRLRQGLEGIDVTLAETSAEGARVALAAPAVPTTSRAAAQDALRERALRLALGPADAAGGTRPPS